MDKVLYRDISIPLKIAVVSSYIVGILWGLFFLLGLVEGFIGL